MYTGQTKKVHCDGSIPPFLDKVGQKASGQQIHQNYLNGGTSSYSITWLTRRMNLGDVAHGGILIDPKSRAVVTTEG